ncbi:hypothetical protein TWF730_009008 [Orbilia blumenaviensis]|uniref:Uncharacterized protein n=1 Tax=Orbilia blumenaviensis TaxID=1796055 RepID=A0AAV9UX40_9PEZI
MPLSLVASIISDACEIEFLWVIKWSMLHHRSFTLKEIQATLDGDRGLQAVKNIFAGSLRTKVLAAYLMVVRFGPRIGLALLTSSYEITYNAGTGDYYRRIDWGYLAGGLILIIGIQSIVTVTSLVCIRSHPSIPPNSSLALSLSLRQCLSPLSHHGSLATASKVVSSLSSNSDTKYQLQPTPFRYISAAQFITSPSNVSPSPTQEDLQPLQRSTTVFPKGLKATLLIPGILSLILACVVHQVIQTSYITGGTQPRPLSGLGSLNTKFLLSFLLQTYSLFLTSFSASIINIIRWATLASSKYHLIDIENILAGNSLWTHWNFWQFQRGSLRGILTSWTTILLNRVLVGLIGWATLMHYYKNLSGGNISTWDTVASIVLWIPFGVTVFLWLGAAESLSRRVLIPDDSSLARAILFGEVVEELEKGDIGEFRYGSVEVLDGKFKAIFSEQAGEFSSRKYL